MFLKIVTKDQVKKMKFKPELFQLANLRKVVEEITGLPENSFKLVFRDAENEEVLLRDVHDMEYFVDNAFSQKFAVVHVQDAKSGNDSHEFIDITMNNQPEQPVVEQKIVAEPVEEPVDQAQTQLVIEAPVEPIETCLCIAEEQFVKDNDIIDKHESSEAITEPVTEEAINIILQNESDKNHTHEFFSKCENFLKALFVPPSQSQLHSQVQSETQTDTKILEDRLSALESQMALLTEALQKKKEKKEQKKEEVKEKKLKKTSRKVKADSHALEVSTLHQSVTCDGCGQSPIIGKRFKCLVCHDYDLCSNCEAKNDHAHPMVRCIQQDNSMLLNKLQRKYSKFCRKTCTRRNMFADTINSHIDGITKLISGRKCRRNQTQPDATQKPTAETKIIEEPIVETKIVEEPITQASENQPVQNTADLDQEKRQLLQFMFGSNDTEAIEELIRRFSNLQLDKFVEVIAKEYTDSFN
jgi:hypothetical protein